MTNKAKGTLISAISLLLFLSGTLGANITGIDWTFDATGKYYDVASLTFGIGTAEGSGSATVTGVGVPYFIGQAGTASMTVGDCLLIEPDLSEGGTAEGWFQDNDGLDTAVITLSGHIYNPSLPGPPTFDGVLITAEVSGDFYAIETDNTYSILKVEQYADLTGGELVTGANLGITLDAPQIKLIYTLYSETPVGPLENFSDYDLDYIIGATGTNTNIQITPIPEPATMLLLGLGSVLVVRKRRK